ncbi:MAG TPA: hypothetical protein VKP65_00375 [Rhodothermales bacterium]|nr:hypothetical protein [Rhodothermales bacterium]
MLKFVITRDAVGRYQWNCYAPQGGSLARSGDSYQNQLACMNALQRVIHILPANAQIEIEEVAHPEEAYRRGAYAA